MDNNRSEHKKEVAGISDMKLLAEMISALNYETLCEFLFCLQFKLKEDSRKDFNNDRVQLSRALREASFALYDAYFQIGRAAEISKPFMDKQ